MEVYGVPSLPMQYFMMTMQFFRLHSDFTFILTSFYFHFHFNFIYFYFHVNFILILFSL